MAEKFKQFATDAFTGGNEDQVIKKQSGSDFDFGWGDDESGGGGGLNIRTAELLLDSGWNRVYNFNVTSGNVCRDPQNALSGIDGAFALFYGQYQYCTAVEANSDTVQLVFHQGESRNVHTILKNTTRNESTGELIKEYIILEPLNVEVIYNTENEHFGQNAPHGAGIIVTDNNDILKDSSITLLNHLFITCDHCNMIQIIPSDDPADMRFILSLRDSFGYAGFYQNNSSLEAPAYLEVDIRVPGLFEVPIWVEFEEV